MLYVIRHIGEHRNAKRLYLDQSWLARCGFEVGVPFKLSEDASQRRLTLRVGGDVQGAGSHKTRVVSRKRDAGKVGAKSGGFRAVIDLAGETLARFLSREPVRVIVQPGTITILPLASINAQQERLNRLLSKIASKEALRVASIAHGIGVASHATHAGLAAAGVVSTSAMINDIDGRYIEQALTHNDVSRDAAVAVVAPIQEAVQDRWLVSKLGTAEVLEMGLSCSGASLAGRAKRGPGTVESHPEVGHLVVPALMMVRELQPAVAVCENVLAYAASASAQLLRLMLRDMGYEVHEIVLRGKDFGSLESRERWYLIACTNGLHIELDGLVEEFHLNTNDGDRQPQQVKQILDDLALDSPAWRTFDYIGAKVKRDAAKGNRFLAQEVRPEDTDIPVLRKSYWKAGSTDPRLVHPTQPGLSRLFTPSEHCRLRGAPEHLIEGMAASLAHEGLGQSVTYDAVKALFARIGRCLLTAKPADSVVASELGYSLALSTG